MTRSAAASSATTSRRGSFPPESSMGETSETFPRGTSGDSIRSISSPESGDSRSDSGALASPMGSASGPGATPARATATPGACGSDATRMSRFTSCGWLRRFARRAFSGRTRHLRAPGLLGPGCASELAWSLSDTLSCPSDCGRVALALTTREKGCSCSRGSRRPIASDWKGSTGKGSRRNSFAEAEAIRAGAAGETIYPHPESVERAMDFPAGWSEPGPSGMPSIPGWPNGSGGGSSNPSESTLERGQPPGERR